MKRNVLISVLTTITLSLAACSSDADISTRTLFGFTLDGLFGTTEDAGLTTGITVASVNGGFCVPEDSVNGTLDLSVVLTKKPAADVTVPLSTSNPLETAVNVSSLTFTSDNWNTPQIITIAGVSEAAVDNNQITSLVFGAATSDDPEYDGLTAASVTGIILIDDDSYSIVVCPPAAGLVTTEAGGTDRFSVVLSRQPAADVNVPVTITSSDLTEATIDKTSLTFTTANWSVPQIITASGVDDTVLDGNVNYTINLPDSASGDPNFNSLKYFSYNSTFPSSSTNTVYGINMDDELSAIVVTPVVLNLTEGGAVGTFNVYLTVEPTGNVTIPVTSGNPARAPVDTALLTFTTGNYNTPQTVTVTPVDNDTQDGVIPPVTVDLGVSTNYQNVDPDNVTVNITDDDTAAVSVSVLSRNTSENGQNATFNVVLTSQPSADVTVTLDETAHVLNNANQEGTIDKTSLTFTTANWNTPQVVTVTPVNDDVMDGNKQYQIAVSNAVSADADYSDLAPTPNFVTVNNNDDDTAGFVIVANGVTTQTERTSVTVTGLATDDSNNLDNATYSRFTIRLRSQPTADVTLNYASTSTNSDGILSVTSQTFTTANWATPQTVTIAGNTDGTNEGNHDYQITITPSTVDDKYSSTTFVAHPAVSLHSCDNDVANVLVGCRRSGSFGTSEGGGTATLHFVTQSNPGGNVCVPVTSSNTDEGTVTTPATVTTSNWNTMTAGGTNKVVATGVADVLFDGNVQYTLIVGNPTCGSATYTGFDPPDVTLYNSDDDQALEFSAASGTTSENGTTATFGVRLRTAPAATVSFSIACASGSTECASLSHSNVTFTTGDWNVYQNITVTGKDDNRVDGTQSSCVTFGPLVTTDPALTGITPPGVCPVNNTDNDRLIWITTPTLRGNYNSGLTVADSNCNDGADANKPSDIGAATYKAMLVDSGTRRATTSGTDATGQLNWVLQPNTEYYLKSGSAPYTNRVFTTNSYGTFSFGTLTTAFSASGADSFWTGLNSNWTTAASNCDDWTNDTSGFTGQYGVGGATGTTSISSGNSACDSLRKLICVQQ